MKDVVERKVGPLTVRIDRLLCVGFGDCIELAPDLFELDEDGIVRFVDGALEILSERVVRACQSCPVDALTVLNGNGVQVAP